MIDHRRNAVVRTDLQKIEPELFARADIHWNYIVFPAQLFEQNRALVAVGWSEIHIKHW